MPATTAAFVGATGGAGTTRTTLEVAAVLAADGRDVAVLDAAYATQGLARHLQGRLDPDMTALVADSPERPLSDGLVDLDLTHGGPASGGTDRATGRVACCAAHAPFERLARAKDPSVAQVFEARVTEAAADFDHVLVDTPPVAANQAIAAVTAAERVAVVTPATDHGADAAQRMRSRLRDVQSSADAVVAVGDGPLVDGVDADAAVPETVQPLPASLTDARVGAAVVEVAETVLSVSLDVEFESGGLLAGRLSSLER